MNGFFFLRMQKILKDMSRKACGDSLHRLYMDWLRP